MQKIKNKYYFFSIYFLFFMQTIDFYTTVIDNYGDAGFSLHLALLLCAEKQWLTIRYFCDDYQLFNKLKWNLSCDNIIYIDLKDISQYHPSKVIFNFFDRTIDFTFLHQASYEITLVNFSYFLLHDGVQALHNTHYVSKNIKVFHYIPSLLPEWWWVLPNICNMNSWLLQNERKKMFPWLAEHIYQKEWVSVFCYKETFEIIKEVIQQDTNRYYFLFDHVLQSENSQMMPFLNILEYEKFLYICDKNIVRWENSFIMAIWAWRPFLWDIYKESNQAHREKIEDFANYLRKQSDDFFSYIDIFSSFNISENKCKYFQRFLELQAIQIFQLLSKNLITQWNLLETIKKYL